jgi:SAM-dependent methyltransferase
MLKMYLPRARGGGEAAFWEEGWSRQAVADAVACCALHPLCDRLAALLPREGLILDGGCGIGAWAIYYSRRGHRWLGVDFAKGALTALKGAAPAIAASAGRVDALPLAENTVDAYYSGGVIEHFENGPQPALAEAYRVLRPGGRFLVVVPDLSPLRQALCPGSRRVLADGTRPVVGFRRLPAPAPDDAAASAWAGRGALQFFQYLYPPGALRPLLEAAGFDVLWDRGVGVQWALMELPAVQRLSARLRGPLLSAPADYYDRVPMAPWAQEPLISPKLPAPARRYLRRLLTLEDDRLPLAGPALRVLQTLASNIRLYVCTKPGCADTSSRPVCWPRRVSPEVSARQGTAGVLARRSSGVSADLTVSG